jgi:hypothetical protein
MNKDLLARLGMKLAVRRNFMIYAFLTVGSAGVVGVTWFYLKFYSNASIWLWVYMVACAFGGAYFWGFFMWLFFGKSFAERLSRRK